MYEAVKNIQEHVCAATQLKQNTVTENTGTEIPFGHSVNFIHMQFQQTQPGGVNPKETELVGYLPQRNLFHQNGIVSHRFNNAFYPLFIAELKINYAARYPGLYHTVSLFHYQ